MSDVERIRQLEAELAVLRRQLADREAATSATFDHFMQLPLPLTIYRLDGHLIAANAAFGELYRIDPATIAGRYNIFEDPETQQRGDVAQFIHATGGSVSRSAPKPYLPAYARNALLIEERIFWSSMCYFPIRDAAGVISHVGEITFDVTEQTRSNTAERHLYSALAERDRRFRALFDNNGLAIALVDATGKLLETNAALCRMLGLPNAQLRGNPMGTYTHPDDVAEDQRLFSEMVRGKRDSYQLEKRYIHADGSIIYARLTNSTVRDESGQVQFVMRLIEDLTARYQAETALRTSRALLHALIDELPAHIYCKDIQGRYLLVNRSFAAALGRPMADILQKTNVELMPPEVAAAMQAQDDALLQGATPQRFEEQYDHEGRLRYFESVKFVLRDDDGRPYAICGISNEITERKRSEQERLQFERHLLETQKLESLGLMAGGIAHDFNNLLVTILGNASLALEELPDDAPARRSLTQIELAARRAADLTRQMLAYAGKSPLIFQPVDLNQIIEETAQLIQSSIPRHVALRFDLAPGLPPVDGDPSQLRQIVMNLLINGAEAITAAAGEVVVHTAAGPIDQERILAAHTASLTAEHYVTLTVRDTGSGMDSATRTRIFEPFFSTKFAGRGLGLAAVLGIVRSHRGAILVESAPEAGSTFQVLLPRHEDAAASTAVHKSPDARSTVRGTVLVIDDEPDIRTVTQQMLRRIGLDVHTAADATSALRILAAHTALIRLILIDVTMPDMAGPELSNALLSIQPDARFIVMSGHNEAEALDGFPPTAVAAFLAKPFTLAELTAQIRRLLPEN
jgi:two-component system, cell cycle sensor histidine kinase and response regulator CckA